MWISLALAMLKAFPALRDIFYKVVELDKANNEVNATKRHDDKDASVDSRINALNGVPSPETQQLGKTDESPRLSTGGNGGT
jgi:hypothetical protein